MRRTVPPSSTTRPAGGSAVLLAVNIGMPQNVAWQGETVFTGVWKHSVHGPQMVRRLNIDGDGQGDTKGHGGEQRAVLVYQIQSYWHWQRHFGRNDFDYGQFGENLTVDGLSDDEVCIGDRYRIGAAEFEVTQPRVTCYRVGLRLGEPALPALLVSHHRPGFYMRVLREGYIEAGDPIVKVDEGPGSISVADIDALLYLPGRDPDKLRLALKIPALSPGWQESFRELLASTKTVDASGNSSAAAEPAWAGFRSLRVTDVTPESSSTTSIHLATTDGSRLPTPRAGQYLTLRLAGAGSPAPVRSYSLSSAPDANTYRITIKCEPGGVASGYLAHAVDPGALLEVAAPRGDFVLGADAGPVLLLSAGIGVTPVLSMLHELAGDTSQRDIWWIHTARGPNEHTLATEAHALLSSLPDSHELVFYTGATADERRRAHARTGRPTKAKLARLGIPSDAYAYLCGPTAFMADMQDALAALGVDGSRIHTELFGALRSINPGLIAHARRPPHEPLGLRGTGPLVTFARSGITTPFRAATHNVLELAEACDIDTRWSCRTGVCHTCVTPLLSGDVTYAPAPLESPGPGEVLICCAHPATEIVLDM